MAMRHHIPQTMRLRAVITLVDPSKKIIEARAADGGIRRLKVLEVPTAFQWPIQGEVWSIYFENGQWYLGNRYPEDDDPIKIEDLDPGDNLLLHQTVQYIIDNGIGGGSGSDANYVHTQGVAANPWIITHPLGKVPSVTVVDSLGNVLMTSVKIIDLDSIEVHFAGITSGVAYLN